MQKLPGAHTTPFVPNRHETKKIEPIIGKAKRAIGDDNLFDVFEQKIYLEVLVVVDRSMSNYYGKEKLNDYILTIMFMVFIFIFLRCQDFFMVKKKIH